MASTAPPLDAAEIHALFDALGEVSQVTYAPPNVYPMSAPRFDPAPMAPRGAPPVGPLGVYAHVPFCNYKCTFCFYATRSVPGVPEMERYLTALERELLAIRPGTPLTQLYVGGGTPTALPAPLLDRLLAAVLARVVPTGQVSTVECSPESVGPEHVRALLRHGIERVSMGVQTNEAHVLASTHRRHDLGQVTAAVELLVGAGFYVNLDLIYGLPGQTEAGFRTDFETAARLGAHSVTCYDLRVNEKTSIARSLPREARLDLIRTVRWRETARAVARSCGFHQTRWHTFQRSEPATAIDASRRFRDETGWGHQFGVGVSARSRFGATIYRNRTEYAEYLERVEGGQSPVEETRALDAAERRLRHVTLTLGDGRPLERDAYAQAFGTRVDDDFAATLERLLGAGAISDDGRRIELTGRGQLVHDLVTRAFYPEPVRRWMDDRQHLVETAPNLRPPSS